VPDRLEHLLRFAYGEAVDIDIGALGAGKALAERGFRGKGAALEVYVGAKGGELLRAG
jgi:hypothetical protein